MAVNTVDYRNNLQADTDRGPTPAVWADCPWFEILEQTGAGRGGVQFYDDFTDWPLIGTQTTQIGFAKYKVFNTGAGTVAPISAINSVEKGGSILNISLDTDNDSGSLAHAYPSYRLTGDKTTAGKLWFECRMAMNTILTNTVGWFVGLAEVEQWTLATGVPFNGGDAITNAAAAIGFRKEEDGLGVIDTVYSDRATSFTNIGDAATSVSAANTWIKLGMIYDPDKTDECITFYADGVKLTTAYSKSSLQALTNLDANALGLIVAAVADSAGTAASVYMDWWRIAQLFPDLT